MLLLGITKIASGDPTWPDWTALTYHCATQPLPLWTGWYVHQLPTWIHRLSAGGMFVVELLLPWAIFVPTRWHRARLGACAGLVLLQVVIGVTGNYGFFDPRGRALPDPGR
jgi:heme A synthase